MKRKVTHLIALMMAAMLLLSVNAMSQGKDPIDKDEIRKKLVPLVGSSNQGTQFFMTFHPCLEEVGPNNQHKIYISSAVETEVTVSIEYYGLELKAKTIPNDIIEFNFSPTIAQMYAKQGNDRPQPEKLWEKRAIIIESTDPIICYGVTRYKYTSDGYLAIPTNILGKEYIAAAYDDIRAESMGGFYPAYVSVVAVYDNTKMKIIYGGNATSQTAGGKQMYDDDEVTMNRGDVWLVGSVGIKSDLTGTRVIADKPVGCISGNYCANVPNDVMACDYLIEQNLPMEGWGKKYHYSPIVDRKKNSLLRIFAKKRNTFFYRNGIKAGIIQRVGGTSSDGGWVEVRGAGGDPKTAIFTADQPINLVQYNPGINDDQVDSDPFQLQLSPIEQYQKSILFNTPGIIGGVGFLNNFINLIYREAEEGGIPDDLEWGQVINGVVYWAKLKDKYPGTGMVYDDPDYPTRPFRAKTIRLPGDGVYTVRAKDPFVAYAYGFDWCDSYGFPTSVAVANLEIPDTLAPVAEFTKGCDGNIQGGRIIDEPRSISQNRSNLGFVPNSLDPEESYNYRFYREDFIPGEAMMTEFELEVIDERFPAAAKFYFVDKSGNRGDTTIYHDPAEFQIRAKDKEIGEKVYYGNFKPTDPPKTLPFVVESLEDVQTLLITEVMLYSKDAAKEPGNASFGPGFTMSGLDLPFEIGPGETHEFSITFDPSKIGDERKLFIDSVGAADTCVSFYTQRIEASVGEPKILVSDYNFGAVTVNSSSAWIPITVENGGAKELYITGFSYDDDMFIGDIDDGDSDVYETRNLMQISETSPVFVNPGEKITLFEIRFTPQNVQQYDVTVYIVNDAEDVTDPYAVIKGRGIQPGLATAGFDWGRRTANIASYKDDYSAALHNDFTYQAYIADGTDQLDNVPMTLINTGTKQVTISKVEIANSSANLPEDAFLIMFEGELLPINSTSTLAKFNNMVIAEEGSVTYDVYFNPREAGVYELELSFLSDAGNEPPIAKFTGTGIHPKVTYENYDFTSEYGQIVIGTGAVSLNKRITNEDWSEGGVNFADNLIISQFDIIPAGTISDMSGTGSEYFRWDNARIVKDDGTELSMLDGNITLAPGEYIEVYGEFEPDEAGVYEADMRVISNAEIDAIPAWDGASQGVDFRIEAEGMTLCSGENTTLTVDVISMATTELIVDDIKILDAEGNTPADISVLTPSVTLQPGEVQQIQLLYSPQTIYGKRTYTVSAVSSTYGEPLVRESKFTVESIHTVHHSFGKVTFKRAPGDEPIRDNQGYWQVGVGEVFYHTVKLYVNEMPRSMATEFVIDIQYSGDFLDLQANTIEVGKKLKDMGYVVTNTVKKTAADDIVTASITISGTLPITEAGEIDFLNMSFSAYEPLYKPGSLDTDRKNELSTITHEIRYNDVCMDIVSEGTAVKLAPVCVDNIYHIVFADSEFELYDVNPNPVQSVGGKIKFSIGIESDVTLTLIDMNGSERTLLSQHMSAGEYAVDIPIEILSNGAYIYKLDAGTFVDSRKMIVNK